jgi:hypothetical protein
MHGQSPVADHNTDDLYHTMFSLSTVLINSYQ